MPSAGCASAEYQRKCTRPSRFLSLRIEWLGANACVTCEKAIVEISPFRRSQSVRWAGVLPFWPRSHKLPEAESKSKQYWAKDWMMETIKHTHTRRMSSNRLTRKDNSEKKDMRIINLTCSLHLLQAFYTCFRFAYLQGSALTSALIYLVECDYRCHRVIYYSLISGLLL